MKKLWPALLILLAVAAQLSSHAQTNQSMVSISWEDLQPRVSFSLVNMVDDHVKSQLSTGLKKRFVVTVSALDGDHVIASRFYSCSITYDLWGNTFLVAIGKHQASTPSLAKATQLCLNTQGLRVGVPDNYRSLQGHALQFSVRGDFDPISKEQCQALVRPGSSSDLLAPVAINLVRREICAAGRSVEISSEPVEVPTP